MNSRRARRCRARRKKGYWYYERGKPASPSFCGTERKRPGAENTFRTDRALPSKTDVPTEFPKKHRWGRTGADAGLCRFPHVQSLRAVGPAAGPAGAAGRSRFKSPRASCPDFARGVRGEREENGRARRKSRKARRDSSNTARTTRRIHRARTTNNPRRNRNHHPHRTSWPSRCERQSSRSSWSCHSPSSLQAFCPRSPCASP